ncbi:MAG: MBL fold metallo-hydrolase [Ruminococcaceae bacterium]|nr:MBL fold metallo-hydrolase [Oscillospiraceae bacterium]
MVILYPFIYRLSTVKSTSNLFSVIILIQTHIPVCPLCAILTRQANSAIIFPRQTAFAVRKDIPKMNDISPLVTQVKLPYFTVDCGMSYVIRLSDGRFVIIDGGYGEYDEPEHLYSVLEKQNILDKITVAAWFITHPHCDHFGNCTLFLNKYYGKVAVENLLFTFPREGKLKGASDMTEFLKTLPKLTETVISSPKRGDVLTYSDAVFEVLFTADDLDDKEVPNINNTSLVMMMTLGIHKTLWLGDAQDQSSEFLCSVYPDERLKCDILQVGHHGYWGGSQELHEKADPKALLWPCPDFWYHPARKWAYNRFFIESENIKAVYRGGIGEYTIDMTLPIEDQLPALFENGDIHFDLSKKSITDLAWSCVTGGQTGFAPLKASFGDDDSVTLTAGEKYSLCQTVFKDKTALTESFTFTVKGRAETDGELFGFIFEEHTPTALDKERIHPLPVSKDKDFEFTLKLDKKTEKASIYSNGECTLTVPVTDTPCDMIIVMKNITVTLKDVAYTV